jgi:hypothetical protein
MAMVKTDKKIMPFSPAANLRSNLARSPRGCQHLVCRGAFEVISKAESCERPNQEWNIAPIIELTNARIRLVKETMLWVAAFCCGC